jgi:hypothetical protein
MLVGGVPTPLKNMSQLGLIILNIWKNKKCSKPPTSMGLSEHTIAEFTGVVQLSHI